MARLGLIAYRRLGEVDDHGVGGVILSDLAERDLRELLFERLLHECRAASGLRRRGYAGRLCQDHRGREGRSYPRDSFPAVHTRVSFVAKRGRHQGVAIPPLRCDPLLVTIGSRATYGIYKCIGIHYIGDHTFLYGLLSCARRYNGPAAYAAVSFDISS